jgi:hypothetical protein
MEGCKWLPSLYDVAMATSMREDSAQWLAPRKLTHEEARREQRLYWSRKSAAERLAAMTELTRRMYRMRGIDIDERKADFTPSRVRRRQG